MQSNAYELTIKKDKLVQLQSKYSKPVNDRHGFTCQCKCYNSARVES